nr:unnamed protein product [uncultured Mediterranean phage uvMED]BAR29226.1 unnamed protein product [uncultured Mediterranean phage uvMED]|tara:strand:- start:298 stop:885 length:588 start_codon:yes stop_codon:yes gene_type:complete
MKVNVKSNIKEITKWTTNAQKKQIPFATANAINQTLFQTRKVMMKQTEQKLNNPTPFTVKSFLVDKAKKTKLSGMLFIREAAEKYLKFQILGGTRSSGKKFSIPTSNAKLNRYGNIVGKRTGLIKKQSQFLQTINGVTGVWERQSDNKLKLIIALKNSANYKPKLPFYTIAQKYAVSKFNKNLINALNKAFKTAK